jgi:hypothetical protein
VKESTAGQRTKQFVARHRGTFGGVVMKWLLILPFIGLLWVPFYNFSGPDILGFPFFYWYQLAWVPLTMLLIWIVDRRTPQ